MFQTDPIGVRRVNILIIIKCSKHTKLKMKTSESKIFQHRLSYDILMIQEII